MNYPYESLVINDEVPVFMLMNSVKYVAMHWHDRIEFLLVLKGKVHVFVGKEEHLLKENDLLLINSNEFHGVESSDENRLLMLQIPITYIKRFYENIEKETFNCQSFLYENQDGFNVIRALIAQLMLTLKEKETAYDIKVQSLVLDLIYQLISKYKVKNQLDSRVNSKKNMDRLTRITNYIQTNYMHPLTLNELAERELLTVPYLSRYFQQQMGQTFIKYLNGIRLEHAVRYLLETESSIIEIAMECGFSNSNTFHKVFKETFQTTPYQYRKKQLGMSIKNTHRNTKGIEDYVYQEKVNDEYLYKYLFYSEKDKN
jgi:AraC-like DNA-binding protein